MNHPYIDTKKRYSRNKVPEFLNKLHELLYNSDKYFNIISWLYDSSDNKFIIIIKDKILVSKILCPRSRSTNNGCTVPLLNACQRQLNNYSFYNMSFSDRNILIQKYNRLIHLECSNKENYLYIYSSIIKNINDIFKLKRDNIVTNEIRTIPNFKENNKERIQIAKIMLDLSKQVYKKNSLYNSNITQNNVLETNINIEKKTDDEDIQKLVENKIIEYFQYLNNNNNNEENIKISILIEVLKNYIFDKNEIEKINKKQIELYNYLEQKVMNECQKRCVLFKCMFEYIRKTISLEKINKGISITNQKYDSIRNAQINNKFNDKIINLDNFVENEEMNKAVFRGKQFAHNDNIHMTDVQVSNSNNNNLVPLSFRVSSKSAQNEDIHIRDVSSSNLLSNEIPWWIKGGTEKALALLHSEPVISHLIEVYWTENVDGFNYNSYWKLGYAIQKKKRSVFVCNKPYSEWKSVCQIVTQVDYVDGISVDELLHRGDWKKDIQPPSENSLYFPKYWRYAK